MILFDPKPARPSSLREFDGFRARLEADVAGPAVLAFTAATKRDGVDVAARAVAESLAGAGYKTLFVGTSHDGFSPAVTPLEQLAVSIAPSTSGGSCVMTNLGSPSQQRLVSRPAIRSAFDALRAKFDYVIVEMEYDEAMPFGTAVVEVADAVVVTVKNRRRERPADAKLSAALDRSGVRFLGVLTLEERLIAHAFPNASPSTIRLRSHGDVSDLAARSDMSDAMTI